MLCNGLNNKKSESHGQSNKTKGFIKQINNTKINFINVSVPNWTVKFKKKCE